MKFVARLSQAVCVGLTLAGCGGQAAPPASAGSSAVTPASSASVAAPASAKPAVSAPAAAGSARASAGNPQSKPQIAGGDAGGFPIKVTYASIAVSDLPYYGALGSGFFQQEHLNVTMVLAPPNVAIPAVSKNEIQFMDSPGNALEGATRGLPMKMVFSAWERAPWTVVGKNQFNSLADLRGKTIGTNQAGSTPYLYLRAALKNAGLALADVKIVSSPGTADTYGQLLAGTLDAAVVSPPFDAMAGDKGFHVVQPIGDALKLPYIGAGASTAFLTDHRPQAVAFLRALMNADKYLKTHPQEATDLVVKYIGSPPEIAKKSIDEMLPTLSDTGEGSLEGVQQAIAVQEELTNTKITVTPEQIVDYGPLHEALGKS
ncbi:MAG: ABC transporter substrate-binding protein [Chloroflexota bacterium]